MAEFLSQLPGVSREDVIEAPGWEIRFAGELESTRSPVRRSSRPCAS